MSRRMIGRRSFLVQVVGGGALAGCVARVAGPAEAQRRTPAPHRMAVDADPGDPARAQALAPPPCSDSDTGRNADPAQLGRRCGRSRGMTGRSDSDAGRYGDPAGIPSHGPQERWVLCPGHRRCS